MTAHAENRIASLVTVESGHAIGTSLAVLRMFHRLGARQATFVSQTMKNAPSKKKF